MFGGSRAGSAGRAGGFSDFFETLFGAMGGTLRAVVRPAARGGFGGSFSSADDMFGARRHSSPCNSTRSTYPGDAGGGLPRHYPRVDLGKWQACGGQRFRAVCAPFEGAPERAGRRDRQPGR